MIAFPIGYESTTLNMTLNQLTAAFSAVRPTVGRLRTSRGAANPATDHNAMIHKYNMFNSMLDSLTDLAHSRLLGIIKNRKRSVDALSVGVRHLRATSVASPSHQHAPHEQGTASHRTRTTRAPESTAIT